MSSFVSPGVYILEQDFSIYVNNLSPTIMGMVGAAQKGPVNEATLITSALQFIQNFGEPSPSFYGPYGALQYLQEGQILYYTRVIGKSGYAALNQLLTGESAAVGSIVVTNGGTGYTTAPPVTVAYGSAPNINKTCTATAQVSGGAVVSVTITNPGSAFGGTPTVTFGGPGTSAAATAVLGATGDVAATVESVDGTFNVGSGTTDSLIINELDWTTGVLVTTARSVTLTAGATRTAANVKTDLDGVDSAWQFTVAVDGLKVKLTHKIKDNLHGLKVNSSIDSPPSTFLGFTDNQQHFGRGVDALPAMVMGSTTGNVTIDASNDHLTVVEEDRRSGVLESTYRTITLDHGGSATLAAIATKINGASLGGSWNLYADASSGYLVLTSGSIENELFGLKVSDVNDSGNPDAIATAAATTLGLDTIRTFSGAKAKWLFQATSPGTWGNDVNVKVTAGATNGTFKVMVSVGGVVQEIFNNLTIDSSDSNYVSTIINGVSAYITVTDNTSLGNPPSYTGDSGANLNYGNDGLLDLNNASFTGEIDPAGGATGLQVYSNPEVININLLAIPGISSPDVLTAVIDLCETRGDCMAILDTPFMLSSQQVINWHNGVAPYADHQAFNTSYAAMYWPWIQVFDPVNNIKIWTPPSGHVARQYAFTDRTTETWYAPAGLNRGHIVPGLQLEHSATHGERDMLYGNGNAINPIINVPQQGITIWGQRTLQRKPSALDRVSVRRLLLYMEKTIATSANFLLFEPNTEILWNQFVDLVSPFAAAVKAKQGLYDFQVRCDKTTNPPDAVDRGEMHGFVILKPVKAAEQIIITFTLAKMGAVFSEIPSF